MPKHLLSLLALCTALVACKKDDDGDPAPGPGPTPDISAYSNLTVGNHWEYAIYQYDTLGNETPTPYVDSVAVIGDTVVNGNTFSIVRGTHTLHSPGAGPYRMYQRDSADCIIGLSGRIIFRLSGLGQVFSQVTFPPEGTLSWTTDPYQAQYEGPAGLFLSYHTRGHAVHPGMPERYLHVYRAANVGVLEESAVFLVPGSGFRKKLVSYVVQ